MPRLSANSWEVLDARALLYVWMRWETCLCHGVLDDLLVSHIGLVADQQLVDALGGVAVDLLQPLLHVVERVHVGDIVDDADAVGAAVVRGCDGAEALLTGCVPLFRRQLQLVALWSAMIRTICSLTVLPSSSIVLIFCGELAWRRPGAQHAGGRTYKVDADGGDVALCVCVVGEPEQQARLSNTRVTDEEELEEVVVSGGGTRQRGRATGAATQRQHRGRWVER